jgi:hypothetical protein
MKVKLSDLLSHVTPQTPVKVLIPSHWLSNVDNLEGMTWVQICYLDYMVRPDILSPNTKMHFTTTDHGRSKVGLVTSDTLVEVEDKLLTAGVAFRGLGQHIRGVSIE